MITTFEQQLRIVEFCAEEVRRQQDGPLEVFGMLDAWHHAMRRYAYGQALPDLADVRELGRRILQTKVAGNEFRYAEPRAQDIMDSWYFKDGWRDVAVFIGPRQGTRPTLIQAEMAEWEAALHDSDPSAMRELAVRCAIRQDEEVGRRFSGQAERTLRAVVRNEDDAAAMAYFAFEHVHPFPDGNGRSGKVIYNWARGTLDRPEFPPAFWGGITNP